MDISVMKSILAISRYRNYQEAADSLSLSVSSISKHISAAENELKLELFIRGTKAKSLMLTDAGAQLIPQIEDILNNYYGFERTAERILNEKSRHLRIAYTSLLGTFGENMITARFSLKYPEIQVEQSSLLFPEMLRMLRSGMLDGCFTIAEVETGKRLQDVLLLSELTAQGQIGYSCHAKTDKLYVAMPASHPLAHNSQVTLEQLQHETFIFNMGNKENYLMQYAERTFQDRSPALRARYIDFSRRGVIQETILAGGGVVPTISRDLNIHSGIRYPELAGWDCTVHGVFLYRRDIRSKAILNFRKCVEDAAQLHRQAK